ncbi:MAG: sulfatase, partial [Planctomycetota bacterium]
SASSWTWPSTASILTGASTVRHGLQDPEHCFLADEFLTLPEAFQLQGVTTAGFSCNPMVSAGKNFDQGFETWEEYSWTLTRNMLPDVAAWLAEHADDQFFLYLQLIDPHTPYRPSARHRAGFRTEREQLKKAELLRFVEHRVRGETYPAPRLKAEVERMQRLYRASVASVDDDIAALLALLEEHGIADETVVAVTSDHGEEFLEHDMLGHANQLYDESVRVPLILVGPSVPSGVRETHPVENRALPATLMALAGLEVPRELAAPMLTNSRALERSKDEPIFFAVHNGSWPDRSAAELASVPRLFAVQQGSLRLLWAPARGAESKERLALFDLERDADARNDLAPDRPADVQRLRSAIEVWRVRELARRPTLLPGGAAAAAGLRALGYGGSQDD